MIFLLHTLTQYDWVPIIIFITGYILLSFKDSTKVTDLSQKDIFGVTIIGVSITFPVIVSHWQFALLYTMTILIIYVLLTVIKSRLISSQQKILSHSLILIRQGQINITNLKKSPISVQSLLIQLRKCGITSIHDVDLAFMDTEHQLQFLTIRDDLYSHLQDTTHGLAIPLVVDGIAIEHNLLYLKKDKQWLVQQLHNFPDIKDISLAVYHNDGRISINEQGNGG